MLKKIFILKIFLIIFAGIGYCYSEDELNRLEYLSFGQIYEDDTLGERITRLETNYFGLSQSGDIDSRISRISQLAENKKMPSMSFPERKNVSIPKKNKIKSILNTASDFFGTGSMTGFTPSFTGSPYGYSDTMYNNEFNNFLNNPNAYCPYQNNINPYAGINSLGENNPYLQNNTYMNNFPIGRNYHQSFYTPQNISTGSGVHIIKD